MTIEEIKAFMKAKGTTYTMLSQKSGIPLTTLKYIFSGKTENPRIDTMNAIETALGIKKTSIFTEGDTKNGFVGNTIIVEITSDEEEILDASREVIRLLGEKGKNLIVDFCEILTEKFNKK